jgi:Ca2+-binding RTX toxin-like protein
MASKTVNVFKRLMNTLVKNGGNDTAINTAIREASNGKFWTYSQLTKSFLDTLNASYKANKSLKSFCSAYAGMNFDNKDTGSITGYDAGGKIVKTKSSVVRNLVPVEKFTMPKNNKAVINGLTVVFPNAKNLSNKEKYLVKGMNSCWIKASLDLIKQSYGISFETTPATCKTLKVKFKHLGNAGTLAYVRSEWTKGKHYLTMYVNSDINIDTTSQDGFSPDNWISDMREDRTICHELTHAIMQATIKGAGNIPLLLQEGLAEIVHGGDERWNNIKTILSKEHLSKMKENMRLNNASNWEEALYGGSIVLLRYLAKQSLNDGYKYTNASKTAMQLTTAFTGTYNFSKWKGVTKVDARPNKKSITINGTAKSNTIYANAGTAKILAGKGDDVLYSTTGKNHIIYGQDGNDKFISTGGTNAKHYGSSGNDTFTVSGGTGAKYYGGNGNDIFTVSGGTSNTYYGNAGIDTFTIGQGTKNLYYGQDGNDKFTVNRGTESSVNGNAGNDIFIVNGGSNNRFYGRENDDKFTINKSASSNFYGGDGIDTFNLTTGTVNNLYGETGKDKMTISGGSKNYASGGDDADVIIINAGTEQKAAGGNGNDNIIINGGSGHTVSGNEDNDTIVVTAGNNNTLNGNNGADKLTIQTGINNIAYGSAGNDILVLANGANNVLYGGSGNDNVTISGGMNGMAYGDSGDDIITVTGGTDNQIFCGTGNDIVVLEGGENAICYADSGNNNFNIKDGFAGTSTIFLNEAEDSFINSFTLASSIDKYTFQMNETQMEILNDIYKVIIEGWDSHVNTMVAFGNEVYNKTDLEQFISEINNLQITSTVDTNNSYV